MARSCAHPFAQKAALLWLAPLVLSLWWLSWTPVRDHPIAAGVLLPSFLAVPGLYRYLRADLLANNAVRREILRRTFARPGTAVTQLAAELGVRRQTITYHLNVLGDFDAVVLVRDGAAVKVFPSLAHQAAREPLAMMMERRWARPVLRLLAEAPECSIRRLAQRLGVSVPTARWYLGKLREAGLLAEGPGGRRKAPPAESHVAVQLAVAAAP